MQSHNSQEGSSGRTENARVDCTVSMRVDGKNGDWSDVPTSHTPTGSYQKLEEVGD